MNLYDFDGTIYNGDSSVHFIKFCYKKGYIKISHFIKIIFKAIQYKTKNITVTELKEFIFSFLPNINDVESIVEEFWREHKHYLKSFYLDTNHSNDIIISASPEFLLKPICKELNVKDLIASDVDSHTGKFNRPNNRGEEKVKMFYKKYPNAEIKEMWSDSEHDRPLLLLAKKSYLVKKNDIYDYHSYKPNLIVSFWRWGWGIYHKNEELWNYLIVGGLTTLVSIGSYNLFLDLNLHYQIANILSWTLAVVFAYFTNRWFVFHSHNKEKVKEALNFCGSRVITLILEAGILFLLIDLINTHEKISKIIAQIIVLITNYIISKLLVFKKN